MINKAAASANVRQHTFLARSDILHPIRVAARSHKHSLADSEELANACKLPCISKTTVAKPKPPGRAEAEASACPLC